MHALPLAGRRILVTRAAHQAGKLSEKLRALGAESVEVPVLEIRPPANYDALDSALRNIASYDWLILTSANAVRALSQRADQLEIRLSARHRLKVAAVGEATAVVAREAGLPVNVVPESYVAEALVQKLAGKTPGRRVLLARAEIARDVIPDALRAVGAQVHVVDAYRNVIPEVAPELLRKALEAGIDAAAFTSSSSVTHLAEAARRAVIAFPFAGVQAISIGPITSKTLRELGWQPVAEASVSDIAGLVAAVESALRTRI
jgi:uroporphyrinogen-III synthase